MCGICDEDMSVLIKHVTDHPRVAYFFIQIMQLVTCGTNKPSHQREFLSIDGRLPQVQK